FRRERLAGKISQSESGQSSYCTHACGGSGTFAADLTFPACQNQIDHPREVIPEFCLVLRIAPRSIAAGAFFFAEVAEIARRGDENVIQKNCRITFYTEAVSQF